MTANAHGVPDRFPHVYQGIPGWFDWQDTYRRWAREVPLYGHIVEVGVFQGKSMSFLLTELANLDRRDVTVHAVDNWHGVDGQPPLKGMALEMAFLDNIERLALQPVMHRVRSQDAAGEFAPVSLDCIWLDGAHDFDSVYVDLEVWWTRLKVGGEIGGHDLSGLFPGVQQAVSRWCTERRLSYQALQPCHHDGPVTQSWLMVKTRG